MGILIHSSFVDAFSKMGLQDECMYCNFLFFFCPLNRGFLSVGQICTVILLFSDLIVPVFLPQIALKLCIGLWSLNKHCVFIVLSVSEFGCSELLRKYLTFFNPPSFRGTPSLFHT